MANCEGNASPPSDSFDFDVGRVAKPKIYLTALGKPCQYMHILDSDAFITPSGSEETELSSDESISSKDSSKRSAILPVSSGVRKIKEEILSDTEDSTRSKIRLKSSKQSPPKSKKFPVVDYSDSDDSGDDKHKAFKKHADDQSKARGSKPFTNTADDRIKVRRKKYSGSSDEGRSRHRSKKRSDSSDEDRFRRRSKKRSDSSVEDPFRHRSRKHSDSSDEGRPQNYRNKVSFSKSMKKEVEEPEYNPQRSDDFHCKVCDISVNSEVTYNTHIQGKRHQKALKAKAVPELVIQSMKESRIPPRVPPAVRNAAIPLKRARHVPLKVESLIQRIAEDYKEGPLPGLDEVIEVRPPVEGLNDISYLCKLCEAKCVPNSIMKHLTGFRHYLRCLEQIDPVSYERHRYTPKKQIEGKVRRILIDDEKLHGRGRIRVEKELANEYARRDEPGPSWRDDKPQLPIVAGNNDDDDCILVSHVEHLDTSMSDFYCKACDAHMNNQAMWESHVRGKRHLKNIKKVPGESTSKIKAVQCSDEDANLMKAIRDLGENGEYGNDIVIVGLGYIKETQGEGGNLYNCYLCGACTSSFDVIDHLNQVKHKIKYLEEMNLKGYPNGIEQIKSFTGLSAFSKESMINDECRKSKDKYGDGKVSVYKSKTMFTRP